MIIAKLKNAGIIEPVSGQGKASTDSRTLRIYSDEITGLISLRRGMRTTTIVPTSGSDEIETPYSGP